MQILTEPTTANPIVQSPVSTIEVGKFTWLKPSKDVGPITWSFSSSAFAALPPEDPDPPEIPPVYWGGWKQGDKGPAWHVTPADRVPFTSLPALKVDPGKFTWVEPVVPAGKRFGGWKQNEAQPSWHTLPVVGAAPCLGVAPGKFKVSAWGTVKNRAVLIAEVMIEIKGELPGPDTNPNTDPNTNPNTDPNVPPVPTAKDVYIAIVRPTVGLTPAQVNLLGDTDFWNAFKTGKTDWGSYAPTDTAAVQKGYTALAQTKQKQGPYQSVLIVLSVADGTVLYNDLISFTPTAKDEIKAIIAKVRK